MKILFLVQHLLSGGAERTVSYLSSYLAENCFDVHVLSISNEVFYDLNDKVNFKSLNIPSGFKNNIERVYRIILRFVKTHKYIKHNNYDIIVCILPDVAKYLFNAKKQYGFKLITSERNNPEIVKDKNKIKLKNKIFTQSDGIIFQTQRAMDYYPEHIREKGIVIHNAIGNEYAYNCPTVSERKKKITAIGRLTEQKDYPTLFTAFQTVVKKYPEYTLEIFGDGPDRAKLEAFAEKLGINKNVIFMGTHKDAIVRAADSACYVMSSKFEGMPNALMEAMAVGLPCISTDCPNGPAELITSGENGLLVPVGDVQALSEAIFKIIEDRDFAESCGTNARKILDTHNINVKAKEYMDYILKIYNEEQV